MKVKKNKVNAEEVKEEVTTEEVSQDNKATKKMNKALALVFDVFDLEDKLLIGNNAIRSDEALHSFLSTI